MHTSTLASTVSFAAGGSPTLRRPAYRRLQSQAHSYVTTQLAFAGVIFAICLPNSSLADPPKAAWKEKELNERFMRSLSKPQCMNKTIASLKAGCSNQQCLTTMAGVTGDCITWASGEIAEFCRSYERNYLAKYCITNELDARRCYLLHTTKEIFCLPEPHISQAEGGPGKDESPRPATH